MTENQRKENLEKELGVKITLQELTYLENRITEDTTEKFKALLDFRYMLLCVMDGQIRDITKFWESQGGKYEYFE